MARTRCCRAVLFCNRFKRFVAEKSTFDQGAFVCCKARCKTGELLAGRKHELLIGRNADFDVATAGRPAAPFADEVDRDIASDSQNPGQGLLTRVVAQDALVDPDEGLLECVLSVGSVAESCPQEI